MQGDRALVLTKSALNSLRRIPSKARVRIVKKLQALRVDPRPRGSKALKERFGPNGETLYRQRSGDYRILYVFGDREVTVLDIGHRKDVYR